MIPFESLLRWHLNWASKDEYYFGGGFLRGHLGEGHSANKHIEVGNLTMCLRNSEWMR